MVYEFPLSAMQRKRIEACRLQYVAFTGAEISFSEYLADILNGAIRNEEQCCKAAKKLAPVRMVMADVH
ncbi:hypothetical protein [Methylobacillus flagellatus]|uniref:Uncharacterized protein n=1 Tax=uncultured marine microorganism HF4000_ANIW133B20 TaxID=455528 RepID=B3T3K1_9ZZZZ|nr:hypothetical protein [Methylobacillus flagellatus]ABZ07160.1 hypothetical protein ALOHA_HF4000ANIW133B20ctg2g12 [uncultured marine microorganism HF4000_ANIW133B20]